MFMFCAIVSYGRHGSLGTPKCKISKWLHAHSWYDSTKTVSISQKVILLTCLCLFNFETPRYKNHFGTNLVKINSVVIEIIPFLCFTPFLVTADGDHLGIQNCKKNKKQQQQNKKKRWLHTNTFFLFQSRVLEILSFLCLCYV